MICFLVRDYSEPLARSKGSIGYKVESLGLGSRAEGLQCRFKVQGSVCVQSPRLRL